jgi:hypothetical protein
MAAGIKVIDAASADRALSAISVIDPNGTSRNLLEMRVIDTGGTDRLVFSTGGGALAVSATPASVGGSSLSTGSITSGATTVSASGGTAPYTHAWTLISYDNLTPPVVNFPTAATTNFTQSNINYNETYSAVFRDTVTDAALATATVDVPVSWSQIPSGAGGDREFPSDIGDRR